MNLNQVTLPVMDLGEACAFYRNMGFKQIVDSPHYARFECPKGDTTFSILLDEGPIHNGSTIYFEHEAVDAWVNEVAEKGYVFDQLPTDRRYQCREAILHDPSGNKIKLYYAGENRRYPSWRIDI